MHGFQGQQAAVADNKNSCCGSWVTSLTSKAFALTGYGLGFFSRRPEIACAGAAINAVSVTVGHISTFLEHKEERANLNVIRADFSDLVNAPPVGAHAAARAAATKIVNTRPKGGELHGYGLAEPTLLSNVLPGLSLVSSWACDIWLMINACGEGNEELSDNYGPLVLGTFGLLLQWADESLKRANIKQRQEQFYHGTVSIAKAAEREPTEMEAEQLTAVVQQPSRRRVVALVM